MTRSHYIRSLFDEAYDGESRFRHKVAGAALGLGGIGVAALAGHALAKGQSFGQSAGDLYHHVSGLFSPSSVHAASPSHKTAEKVIRGAAKHSEKAAEIRRYLRDHTLQRRA